MNSLLLVVYSDYIIDMTLSLCYEIQSKFINGNLKLT